MQRRHGWWIVAGLVLGLWAWQQVPFDGPAPSVDPAASPGAVVVPRAPTPATAGTAGDDAAWLPAEAQATLRAIRAGGPHPYRQDGAVFQNRERRLPRQPAGYYREYTVETPGSDDRGARRIVAGGDPPLEFFYTGDHYGSFRRLPVAGGGDGRH